MYHVPCTSNAVLFIIYMSNITCLLWKQVCTENSDFATLFPINSVFRRWNFCPTIALHTFYRSLPLRTCAGPLWSPPLCSQWQIQMLCGRSFCHPIIIKLFLGSCPPHCRVLQRSNCFPCYVIHNSLTMVTR